MLLAQFKTPSLSQSSALVGSRGQSIEPRRDCEPYIKKARIERLEITQAFETHRLRAGMVFDAEQFSSGRQFAAWLGLTPQQHSTIGPGSVAYLSRETDTCDGCLWLGRLP